MLRAALLGCSLLACGGTSPTRGAEPVAIAPPAGSSSAPPVVAASPAPPPAAVASPALVPVALASPAHWEGDGWHVPIPRTRGIGLGERDPVLSDAVLRAHGAQRIEPTQWLLRAGAAPCLATVTAYVEYDPMVARDGSYDERRIEAMLTGCVPFERASQDDGSAEPPARAWVVGPAQLTQLAGDGSVRLIEASVKIGANVNEAGRRSRRQRRVPVELAKLLTLPACARGCVRDWTLRTLATAPVIQQIEVLDHDLTSRTDGDGSGAGPRWETAVAAHAVIVGRTGEARALPRLVGALVSGDAPRVVLFDDGSSFATARFDDGSIGPAVEHFVHEIGGY